MKYGKLLPLVAALFLVAACSTADYDDPVTAADVIEPSGENTHDAPGPPDRIESTVGAMHPSSASGGAGNAEMSGTNTNLNPPPPARAESTVVVTEEPPAVTVTETRVEVEDEEPVVIAEVEERVMVEEPEEVEVTTTRTMVRKD
ncbi:MAG: hypothetical protein ACRD2J_08275 [Thermoanaerobaculia bacterium]